jgi:arsenate reductase
VGVDTAGFRSKTWDEFVGTDAPRMRIVITVCDSAAAEPSPFRPGGPVKAHWGYPDLSNAAEAGRKAAFELTRQAISYRMPQLLALPIETLSDREPQSALLEISRN